MSRIDRDGLLKVLDGWMPASMRPFLPAMADAILLLDQPTAGVKLNPEEARLAREWYTRLPIGVTVDDVALAQKLEASA